MKEAFDFLNGHLDVAFATVENGKPKIRVFQIMHLEGATLWFATSPRKDVYRQLQKKPNVELLAMAGNISVRITGKVYFDVPDFLCKEIYEANPVLSRLYEKYSDLVYFRLPVRALDYYDLTPNPPVLKHEEYGTEQK